jgi:nucleotide-binding universal stress UspA family protein
MIHFQSSKILVPVDFSETSLLAFRHAAYLAHRTQASLHILHVINTPFMSQNMFLPVVNIEDTGAIEQKVMEKLVQLAEEMKSEFHVETESIIRSGSPATEIVKAAKEIKASMVVMGTHGYSPIQEIMIGSVALKVITRAPCPTMMMRSEATHQGYANLIMPLDDTTNSRQKVNYVIEMAHRVGAKVHALGMLTDGEKQDKPGMEVILHEVQTIAREKGVSVQTELIEKVKNRATATVRYCNDHQGDLIVIMTDQDAELSGLFLGPYSQQIIHLSKVPVIAIRPQDLYVNDVTYLPGTSGI